MFACQFRNLFWQKISSVGDWIVIKHAGERGGLEDRCDMRLHFAPVSLIDVRRENHQAVATEIMRSLCQGHTLSGRQRRDGRDERCSSVYRLAASAKKLQFLFVRQGCAFTE